MSNFGERLKQLRKEYSLTQKDLASRVFVSPSYISKLEKNAEEPSPKLVTLLAMEFNVSTDYLLSGVEDKDFKRDLWGRRDKNTETEIALQDDLKKFIDYVNSSESAIFQSEIMSCVLDFVDVLKIYANATSTTYSVNFMHILSDYFLRFCENLRELEGENADIYKISFQMSQNFQELVNDIKDMHIQRHS